MERTQVEQLKKFSSAVDEEERLEPCIGEARNEGEVCLKEPSLPPFVKAQELFWEALAQPSTILFSSSSPIGEKSSREEDEASVQFLHLEKHFTTTSYPSSLPPELQPLSSPEFDEGEAHYYSSKYDVSEKYAKLSELSRSAWGELEKTLSPLLLVRADKIQTYIQKKIRKAHSHGKDYERALL
jgi:hypothetical protein